MEQNGAAGPNRIEAVSLGIDVVASARRIYHAAMIETRGIETTLGMVFDLSTCGDDGVPLVLMLHGFGVSRFFWNSQVRAVADARYVTVAPNQRAMPPVRDQIRPITPITG